MGKNTIPATRVQEKGYELLTAYKNAHKLNSIGEAVRQLLKQSPALMAFADEDDLSEYFDVNWGGDRRSGSETSEN